MYKIEWSRHNHAWFSLLLMACCNNESLAIFSMRSPACCWGCRKILHNRRNISERVSRLLSKNETRKENLLLRIFHFFYSFASSTQFIMEWVDCFKFSLFRALANRITHINPFFADFRTNINFSLLWLKTIIN